VKKGFLFILRSFIILLLLSIIYLPTKISIFAEPLLFGEEMLLEGKKETLPFLANETIDYIIKLKGIKIGRATLTYKGKTKLDGKDVHLIIFYTNTMNFKDKETIYADIDNFLPLRIERSINNWGKKIYIIEEYDQKNYTVTITRIGRRHKKLKQIQKNAHIQNAILLTFLYRKLRDFEIGKDFPVTLPLAELVMRFTKKSRIKVPYGLYEAYLAESFPKGYRIWFEESNKAIPVKISGPLFLGSVSLEMADYRRN
jgi:hypothetical protein